MKQPRISNEFGVFPVVEFHWSVYDGKLETIVSSTKYDPECSIHRTIWEIDPDQPDNGVIILQCMTNRRYKAVLML